MWLLYKAKHDKVNGCGLIADRENNTALAEYMTLLLSKIKDTDSVLSLVNRYINLKFMQSLPEDLPHIPTWILAAHAYASLSVNYSDEPINIDESQVLKDIIKAGELILEYVRYLAQNTELWHQFNDSLDVEFEKIQGIWSLLQMHNNSNCLYGMEKIYSDLRSFPYQWLASSSSTQQLELFTPITADISHLFERYILENIPTEFLAAQEYGLGQLQLNFCVDASVNTFADLHIAYSNDELPDHSRDVIFKVEVYFKYTNSEQRYLLTTSWFAHDLVTSAQRFETYYNGKFAYKLKHNRYHWISLDGRCNHVESHGNTPTHKPINHDKLAKVYQEWLINATPINSPVVQDRIRKNPKFMHHYKEVLESGSCTEAQTQPIELLRTLLKNELNAIILQQRTDIAVAMQKDVEFMAAVARIDAQYSVLNVFGRLLNENFLTIKLNDDFNVLIQNMQCAHSLDIDLKQRFDRLFVYKKFYGNFDKLYACGEFYGKVQAVLAQLKFLQTELTISRLRVF